IEDAVTEEEQCEAQKDCKVKKEKKSKTRSAKGDERKNRKPDLEKLVKDGIITQEAAEKIDKYLQERFERRMAEKEKIKNMSPKEKEKYFEEKHKTPRIDVWTDLVSQGIITEKEAEAIKSSFKEEKGTKQDTPAAPAAQ
ncbi:MAG: hypothetical protein LBC41_16480, partial [Clostridiales bacterium]|nr:hypothetical protein [Clostridiales bacterium]